MSLAQPCHRSSGKPRPRPAFLRSTLLFVLVSLLGATSAFAADTGSLRGKVEGADGSAVAGAHVQLVDLRLHVDTDADGSFEFTDVPAGRALLRVESLADGELTRRVDIVVGETTEVTLDLAVIQHDDEILVTATGLNRSQSELAQQTTVLRGEELQFRLAPTLGETLAQQAGIHSTFFGQGASRPVIRGIGGDRVRMLNNGVDVGDVSSTSADHAVTADAALAERIEVLRGPATLLYGSSAIGGVVNVIDGSIPTEIPEEDVTGFVDIGGGSVADERRGTASLTGGGSQWAWHVGGSYTETDDYDIPGFAEAGHDEHGDDDDSDHGDDDSDHGDEHEEEEIFGTLPNSDVEKRSGSVGFTHFGERGFFGVSVSGFDSNYGIPGGHGHGDEHGDDHGDDDSDHGDDDSDHGDDDSDHGDDDDSDDHGDDHGDEHGEEDIRLDLERVRYDLHGEITQPFGAFQGARVRLGVVDYEHIEFEGDEVGTTFSNDSLEGRLEFIQKRRGNHEGSFGVQFSNKELEAIGAEAFIPKNETTSWALFTFQEIESRDGNLVWQLGARWENQENRNDVGLRQRDFDGLSASVGFVWRPADDWSIALSVARSTKLPNGEELYSNGPHPATQTFDIGDPNLDEETSLGFDLAIRRTTGRFTGALSIFRNTFDDYIFQAFTGEEEDGFPVIVSGQADATFEGAELEARVVAWERGDAHFDLSLTGDMVEAEFDAGGFLPRIPANRLGVGLHYHQAAWHGYVEVWDVASQNDVAENETTTEGYTMVNAGFSYRIVTDRSVLDLILRGRNLTDEDARNHVSYLKDEVPLPGRDISLSARWTF
ncbi:MAG: TonB-dependent receptor [Acidobacteriota bacterium]